MMTEILINELSLNGQFNSVDDFILGGALLEFNALLNEMKGDTLLYKKFDFYESKVSGEVSIYTILTGTISRQYDEIRKMKSILAFLIDEPFWENNRKHSPDVFYYYNGNYITNTSLAEACERDKIVISFFHVDFTRNELTIKKDETEINIKNLNRKNDYIETAWAKGFISCEEYCKKKFKNNKLDFSKMDQKEGFSSLQKSDETLFIDSFRKFSELTWPQIIVDDALEYKEYKDTKRYLNLEYPKSIVVLVLLKKVFFM